MQAYDPLDYENLARNIVDALLTGAENPLPPSDPFEGAGVYAIYYHGSFEGYRNLVETVPLPPIYVGKAVPMGARKGKGRTGGGRELHQRLTQHGKSIAEAQNIQSADFTCRYLVVVPVWITLAERFLVEHYQPVWNVAVDGFGNHDPGAGRRSMKRPRWDILHPGRPWAARLTADESFEGILQSLQQFLEHKH